MKFLEKNFPGKIAPLNFDSLLIISYGRSGSTLLQGMLNSIEGVVIRGENFNMCFHLFKAYQAIIKSKSHTGHLTQNPFYGAELLDEEYFLNQSKETVKNLLLADRKNDPTVKCYGFKEIRYSQMNKELPGFLDFLKKIFPKPCFVFNTRNKENVAKSWIHVGWPTEPEKKKIIKKITKIEASFFNAMKVNKANSFHITYEDMVGKTERLVELFSFLGASFDGQKIDEVMSLRHSYKPSQDHIKKLPYKQFPNKSI